MPWPRLLRRVWSSPLAAHAALLVAALVGLSLFAGVRSSFTVDEANVILQAQAIEHGHWTLPDPLPAVDRGTLASPVLNGTLSPQGVVPIARHLLYTVLLAGLLRLGGPAAVTGLSLAGTVMAAMAAAWLARLYAPDAERLAFWVTGLASPLFLYGVVDTGQSVAAAAGAVSTALLIVYWRGGRLGALAGSAPAVALAVMTREEAVVWCAATAVAAVAVAIARPAGAPAGRRLLAGVGAISAAAACLRLAELLVSHHVYRAVTAVAGNATTLVGVNSGSWVNRIGGTVTALLGFGPVGDVFSLGALPVFLAGAGLLLFAALAGVAVRRGDGVAAAASTALAAAFVVARLLHAPASTVSGLFAALPVAWLAVWTIRRRDLVDPTARFLALSAAVFVVGVAVTIHPDGGGLQWGGRYFLVALPVVVPLGVEVLRERVAAIRGVGRFVVVACLAVACGAGTWQMAASVVRNHRSSAELASVVREAAAEAPPGDGGKPVALSASYPLGSLWPAYGDLRILYPTTAQLDDVARRMRAAGVDRAVMVTTDPAFDNIDVGASYRVVGTVPVPADLRGWNVEILMRR